jgi:hypothetical protein
MAVPAQQEISPEVYWEALGEPGELLLWVTTSEGLPEVPPEVVERAASLWKMRVFPHFTGEAVF